jgi:hypothetical protein
VLETWLQHKEEEEIRSSVILPFSKEAAVENEKDTHVINTRTSSII